MLSTALRLSFALCMFAFAQIAHAQTNQTSLYDSLYTKAYHLGNTQPDSAIHYARLATKATQKQEEQANAHWLIGFYAQQQGYYSLAIKNYQKAYDLYPQPIKKAAMLDNMAVCYGNIDNYDKAASLMKKAVVRYERLRDSIKLGRVLQLLGNIYRSQSENYSARKAFSRAIQISLRQNKKRTLASIYADIALLKKEQMRYDSATYYQRLALATYQEPNTTKQMIRLSQLAWYYMRRSRPDSAQHYLAQAQAVKTTNPKALVYLYATKGFMQFVARQDTAARRTYQSCDSLLRLLRQSSPSPVQKKFVAKLSYDIYHSGYQALGMLWSETERQSYSHVRAWFKDKMLPQKHLYDETRLNITLQDSLVINQQKNKVQVIKKIAPWWWVVMVATLAIAAIWVYNARTQEVKARAQEAQAHADFVAAIEASPVKGIGHISKAEASMLAEIEHRQKNKLTPDDIKLFLLVVRGYTYKTIAVQTVFTEGNIKTKVRRAKKACGVDSLKELM